LNAEKNMVLDPYPDWIKMFNESGFVICFESKRKEKEGNEEKLVIFVKKIFP
jgi:hypothetical protein